jgi:tRNA(fMet)-specific endonuclease VapC
MFLLDTDHISFLQRTSSAEFARLSSRISQYDEDDIYFSVVSFHEQALGWNSLISRSRDSVGILRGYEGISQMIVQYTDVQILPYDQRAATAFERLRSARIRIGTFDLRIAAMALVNNFTVVSRNVADFRQVPGLLVENWVQ